MVNGLTLGHQSTSTPAAQFNIGVQFNLNSSTTADQNAARIRAEWSTATHLSRASDLVMSAWLGATEVEVARFRSDASSVFAGTVSTVDPTSGAGPAWKLGAKKTAVAVTISPTDYVEVAIAGVTYKLAIVT